MRRLLGLKDATNTRSSKAKGKERQQDSASAPAPLPDPSSSHSPMEVHVNTEVHSTPGHLGFNPLTSTVSLASSQGSPASSDSRPLPPDIRVPTHPYPYWQGYTHTPSSSSQSSLESPSTPSHVSWLSSGNGGSQGSLGVAGSSSYTNLSLTNPAFFPQPSAGPSSSGHSLLHGRSSPSPHFPPPPPTNPPPNVVSRPKLLHTKSTHSLRVPVQEFFNQQLSPIVEQDYFSPEKRPVSLPSSSHDGGGSRVSTAHTARTSAALTPISPVGDGISYGSATVTPVTPVPMTPVLVGTRGMPQTLQMQAQTPVTPGGVVPFTRMKEEEANDSPRPSPVSTFILRPLNRSISLSSTRTHQTAASTATPPVIPPLDLKPEFKGQAFLTTPTELHSRGLLDIPLRDEDSVSDRRESFVTARTGARESKYSIGQDEVFVDAEEGYIRNSDGTLHQFDTRILEDDANLMPAPAPQPIWENNSKSVKPPVPARTAMHARSASRSSSAPPSYSHPPGPQSSDNLLHPNPYLHPHRSMHTPPPTMHPSRVGVSAPSLQDLGSATSTSSSFIDRRFAPSSLYLPPASERETAHKAGTRWAAHLEHVDAVQVLFWLGFVAPWCWLIGGWLVSGKPRPTTPGPRGYPSSAYGPVRGLGVSGSALPLWTTNAGSKSKKSLASLDTMRNHGYPFVAPSASSLMPPPPPYPSRHYGAGMGPVVLVSKRVGRRNPWVRRCRIAAVVCGVLLVVAFLVALVVALTTRTS